MNLTSLRDFAEVASALVLPIVGLASWLLRNIWRELAGIRAELRTMNGKLIMIEQWRHDHDDRDDERHQHLCVEVERVRERVAALR